MEESAAPTISTRSVGIRYGLIMGVIGIALFVVFIVADVDIQGPARWLNVLVLAVLIFLAHKHYKDNGDGFMTIGQGTGIGFGCVLCHQRSQAFLHTFMSSSSMLDLFNKCWTNNVRVWKLREHFRKSK